MQIVPYLRVRNAPAALEFYVRALGARDVFTLEDPAGGIVHAQFLVGDVLVMLAEENAAQGLKGPQTLGGCSIVLELRLGASDGTVDEHFARAVAAGAKAVYPPTDQFFGERSARVEDPFGHHWIVSFAKETLSADEMQRRFDALLEGGDEAE